MVEKKGWVSLSREKLLRLPLEGALEYIGRETDWCLEQKKVEPLKSLIKISDDFKKEKELSKTQLVLLDYFIANMWANIRVLSRDEKEHWDWEQEEVEKEIIYLRRGKDGEGFDHVDNCRKCQILTNLGNNFSYVGRFVEALEYWNKALTIDNSFGLAIGNKGYGLMKYAQSLYDKGHKKLFFQYAYPQLKRAIGAENVHKSARIFFQNKKKWIESILTEEYLNKELKLEEYSLGKSEEEIKYRRWCLENRLFLNPLNDLGAFSIAGRDIFILPSIVTGINEGPYYFGFFNQMKQEFVSARYFYYEGINATETHFSDRDVFLYNTLDYPEYSLGIERVKASYRMVYSLFDKIAYFLTEYFNLEIKRQVNFRGLWYWNEDYKNALKDEFKRKTNWPLRGLFWLSKDLLSNNQFEEAIDPDARKIVTIRNHIEHKYLKLHSDLWSGGPFEEKNYFPGLKDSLAYSLYRKDFESKTLKLIKLARAALIYLSLAVHWEEKVRDGGKDEKSVTVPAFLEKFDDEWKV